MVDYYAVLRRKIRDASEDPAKMREVVYEAARLALRRQVYAQRPPLGIVETERHMSELEAAIARLEAEAADLGRLVNREPAEAPADCEASWPIRSAPAESEEDAAFSTVGDPQIRDPPLAESADQAGSGELRLPNRARRSSYLVNPLDFVNPEVTSRVQPTPRPGARMVMSGLRVTFQLAVAALAVAAFYVAMWGRNSSVQTAGEMQPATGQTSSAQPASQAGKTADGISAVAAAPLATTPAEAALPFPRPAVYGVYAIVDSQLIELEEVQATPVDPRTPNQLQIVKPGRIVSAPAKLAFVVFRRDLVATAPVSVRIAARIAHSMNFDSTGKAVVMTPATDTWLIRDQGYDLRVSPLRDSAEMVMLRPENSEFSFPPGRYELMLGGQAYDFVVAGEVTDPAHCVEGVATVRGPVFYECKPVL